jgi:hypothetical protein
MGFRLGLTIIANGLEIIAYGIANIGVVPTFIANETGQ